MIAIISSSGRERVAFASLCESRGWPCAECDSLRTFRKLIQHTRVRVVLTRHRLNDGFSDDVIAALSAALLPAAKVVVLLPSGTPPTTEARQVKLGADCVQRDPVRTEVLLEYLAKYHLAPSSGTPTGGAPKKPASFRFAGAHVHCVDRQLQHGRRTTKLTPREIDLLEVLVESEGQVISYHNLFSEILGRRFRGDTGNLRVLLGLLDASARRVGLPLRRWVEVIPKLGYRYRRPPASVGTQKKLRACSPAR